MQYNTILAVDICSIIAKKSRLKNVQIYTLKALFIDKDIVLFTEYCFSCYENCVNTAYKVNTLLECAARHIIIIIIQMTKLL
jgi:hypothetical protein